MDLTFQQWLDNQMERQDPIGALARAMAATDFSYVQSGRRSDEHKTWADIITRHGEPEHVLTFNKAWREYQRDKETITT